MGVKKIVEQQVDLEYVLTAKQATSVAGLIDALDDYHKSKSQLKGNILTKTVTKLFIEDFLGYPQHSYLVSTSISQDDTNNYTPHIIPLNFYTNSKVFYILPLEKD